MGKGTVNPDGNSKKHRSYFGDNGWLRTGMQTIAGKKYRFDDRGWLKYSDAMLPPREDPEEVWAGIRKIEVRLNNGMHLYLPSFRDDFKEGGHYTYIGWGYRTSNDEYLEYYNIERVNEFTDRIYSGKDYFKVNTRTLFVGTQDDIMSISGEIGHSIPKTDNVDTYMKISEAEGKVYYINFSIYIGPNRENYWHETNLGYISSYADKIVKSAWVE